MHFAGSARSAISRLMHFAGSAGSAVSLITKFQRFAGLAISRFNHFCDFCLILFQFLSIFQGLEQKVDKEISSIW